MPAKKSSSRQGLEGPAKGGLLLTRSLSSVEGRVCNNGAGRDPRNPAKLVKNGLLAIFYFRVFCENTPATLPRYDAPSMALLVGSSKKWKDVKLAKEQNGRANRTTS